MPAKNRIEPAAKAHLLLMARTVPSAFYGRIRRNAEKLKPFQRSKLLLNAHPSQIATDSSGPGHLVGSKPKALATWQRTHRRGGRMRASPDAATPQSRRGGNILNHRFIAYCCAREWAHSGKVATDSGSQIVKLNCNCRGWLKVLIAVAVPKDCMKPMRHLLLVAAVALGGMAARSQARQMQLDSTPRDAETLTTNAVVKVTDAGGLPVPDATVEYWSYAGTPPALGIKRQATTAADGGFAFPVSRAQGYVVARKSGLAPDWRQTGRPLAMGEYTNMVLILGAPTVLAGAVVNDDGSPVPDVDVLIVSASREFTRPDGSDASAALPKAAARESFSARTDSSGHFRFDNLPSGVTVALSVKAPGKTLRETGQAANGYNSLPWQAGQEDIKLVVEPAGSVEGKIVMAGTKQLPPIATLTLQPDFYSTFGLSAIEPVKSGPDGTFRITDVPAGPYHLTATFGTNSPPEWVAESAGVEVASGQTKRDVQLTATPGGLLEVSVRRETDHKPVAEIRVTARARTDGIAGGQIFRPQAMGVSDSNGLARLRLPPGDYQVFALRAVLQNDAESATVAAGTTNRIEMEVPAPQKISVVVRTPDGRPAAGVALRAVGSSETLDPDAKTDPAGNFEFDYYPHTDGQGNLCIFAHDDSRDLAAAVDVDEISGVIDLKLEPALTLAVRVESEGHAVTNARGQLIFWTGNSGAWLSGFSRNRAGGLVELPALPAGRKYGLAITAPGYGQKTINEVSLTDAGRQELEAIELMPAKMKLAGRVVDADDKPVGGCQVNLSGEGQPAGSVRTDHDGRFVFERVCEGAVELSANGRTTDLGYAYGSVRAEAGDTNVVLQFGQTQNLGAGTSLNRLRGIITDTDGKPVAGARVAVLPRYLGGTAGVQTGPDGAYRIAWTPRQRWQNASPILIVRDVNRNSIATADLDEGTTNLDVQLKPALTLAGSVQTRDGGPLAGAQVEILLRSANTSDPIDQ